MKKWPIFFTTSLLATFFVVLAFLHTRIDGVSNGLKSDKAALQDLSRRMRTSSWFVPLSFSTDYFAGLQKDEPDGLGRDYIRVVYDSRWMRVTVIQGHSQLRRIHGISRNDIHAVAACKGDLDDLAKLGW